MLRLASVALSSGRGFAERTFRTEAPRRMIPALALHTDVGPDDPLGAIVGFMLAVTGTHGGFQVPAGGAGSITRALITRLREAGGHVHVGARVEHIVMEGSRAIAVRTSTGEEVRALRAIVADTAAPTLFLELLESSVVPSTVLAAMRRFRRGFGTFKVDWALDEPVPWTAEAARESAVVHTGESLDDLARFTREVREGRLPEDPYLVIGQQSLMDPTRAPRGKHTLYAYSRVPSEPEGGYTSAARKMFLDRIEARIEELAPGFRDQILSRAAFAPPDLEAMNENLLGGDLGGGTADITNQLFLRPMFPYFRYRTPIRGLYLGSSYAHPGAGVHGMCGYNAAQAVLSDIA
jgi:phytoene dehydrogenase-like protein